MDYPAWLTLNISLNEQYRSKIDSESIASCESQRKCMKLIRIKSVDANSPWDFDFLENTLNICFIQFAFNGKRVMHPIVMAFFVCIVVSRH